MRPGRLTIQVRRTAIVDKDRDSILTALRRPGMRRAPDDFGAGLSTLLCLGRPALDMLKNDCDVDANLGQSNDVVVIMYAVVATGRAHSPEVIAQGAAPRRTPAVLQAARVHGLQGSGFGRPVAPTAVAAPPGGSQPTVAQRAIAQPGV